jgi:tetratricopeptide (TPR) repeat protein
VPFPALSQVEPAVAEHLEYVRQDVEGIDAGLERDQRAALFGQAGMRYHAYAFYEAATACYRNARLLDPADVRWSYYAGRAHQSAGQVEPAVAALERARELLPDDLPTLIALADLQRVRERPDLAEPLYLRATELEPGCASAYIGLGRVASIRRDWQEAAERFEQALSIAPDASIVNYQLGLAYRRLGRTEEAVQRLAQRGDRTAGLPDPLMDEVERLARGWRIHNNRGSKLFDEGRHAEALEEFRLAMESAPEEPEVLISLGSSLTALGQEQEALELLRRAVEIDPDRAMAHYNLGTLAARAGDDARAVEHYRRAISVDPEHTQSHFNLGNALRRSGRFEDALPHYRRVVHDDPANVNAWLAEALTLIRLHRWSAARLRLEEAVAAFPDARPLRGGLIRVLAAAPEAPVRDGVRALALAEQLLSEQRSLPYVEAYAMAAAESGDFELAVKLQEDALQAVRQAGRSDLSEAITANLEHYRAGRPCRVPWPDDDPVLSPRPVRR